MLNIVVPLAGRGSRFISAGFKVPKPLIPIDGVPMIAYVVNNLRPARAHRFLFLCREEHISEHRIDRTLGELAPGCGIIPVPGVTEGAACTVLLAEKLASPADPLMIANGDQLVDAGIDAYLDSMGAADGLIMTMRASDPKWSFVRLDGRGRVAEVAEKRVLSPEATVGIYNFKSAGLFYGAARAMIKKDLRVNGEFYVAPVYNELIAEGREIAIFNSGAELAGMYGLGTPSDVEKFLALGIAKRFLPLRKN